MRIKDVQETRQALVEAPEATLIPGASLPRRIEFKVASKDQ